MSLTLQTLPIDCLLEILSKLSIPECLELGTLCKQLKIAVTEHLRNLTTLSVIISDPNSPSDGKQLKAFLKKRPYQTCHEYIKFGPSRRSLRLFESNLILEEQSKYFHRDEFVVLYSRSKLDSFVRFITKFMTSITNLAIIIDYPRKGVDMDPVKKIIEPCKNSVKVLMLDQTSRAGYRTGKCRELPDDFYQFIEGLEALQVLYYFPKPYSTVNEYCENNPYIGQFLTNMFQKLVVFHSKIDYKHRYGPVGPTGIEELLVEWDWDYLQVNEHPPFPALKKLICDQKTFQLLSMKRGEKAKWLPNLQTLQLNEHFYVNIYAMQLLNVHQKLEKLICTRFHVPCLKVDDEPSPFQQFNAEEVQVNYTVKKIIIENLPNSRIPFQQILADARTGWQFFGALQTVIIRTPYTRLDRDTFLTSVASPSSS